MKENPLDAWFRAKLEDYDPAWDTDALWQRMEQARRRKRRHQWTVRLSLAAAACLLPALLFLFQWLGEAVQPGLASQEAPTVLAIRPLQPHAPTPLAAADSPPRPARAAENRLSAPPTTLATPATHVVDSRPTEPEQPVAQGQPDSSASGTAAAQAGPLATVPPPAKTAENKPTAVLKVRVKLDPQRYEQVATSETATRLGFSSKLMHSLLSNLDSKQETQNPK